MKWLIGIVTAVSLLGITGCITSANAQAATSAQFVYAEPAKAQLKVVDALTVQSETHTSGTNKLMFAGVATPAQIAKHNAIVQLKLRNAKKIQTTVHNLKKYVNHTWYVFSGASPAGWDCSGLVRWAYEQMGVTLEHRASIQKHSGILVKNPKLGDIVAFTYKGTQSAYHVGIYLGPDKMIHAGGGKGERTSIVSISKFAGNYSKVTYTRVLNQ
jgi:cell wall-associated NlpC family hydrolase